MEIYVLLLRELQELAAHSDLNLDNQLVSEQPERCDFEPILL